jgi:hypothetical protein
VRWNNDRNSLANLTQSSLYSTAYYCVQRIDRPDNTTEFNSTINNNNQQQQSTTTINNNNQQQQQRIVQESPASIVDR